MVPIAKEVDWKITADFEEQIAELPKGWFTSFIIIKNFTVE